MAIFVSELRRQGIAVSVYVQLNPVPEGIDCPSGRKGADLVTIIWPQVSLMYSLEYELIDQLVYGVEYRVNSFD